MNPLRGVAICLCFTLLCGCLGGGLSQDLRQVGLPPPPPLHPPPVTAPPDSPRKIFVDGKLPVARCRDYDAAARACGGGEFAAFRDLNDASAFAGPGDSVLVREAVIHTPFVPRTSGAEGRPVTYQPFPGETVVFSGIEQPAWQLSNRFYLVLQGFRVERVLGWARLENAHYNVIRNNEFAEARARGTTGGVKLVASHYNRIEGNRFTKGNDSLVLQASDRNLVSGNRFRWARHSLLSLRCGNYNVIRGNRFHNERQKAMEVYDCEGVSDAPYRLDATKRNLIEGNRFIHARASSRPHKYNAIQYAGQLGIVRNNLFRDNRGGAVNFAVYPDEALYNYGHRVYNNTFVANRCFALIDNAKSGERIGGHGIVNNLFYANRDCGGGRRQVELLWEDLDAGRNALLEEDPGFVSLSGGDPRPPPQSGLVDGGVFLTHTLSAGRGRRLPVADVAFFFDGAGVPGVDGDEIRLEGTAETARVVEVDFASASLLLDRELQWRKGQGVALRYAGDAPDMGAYESLED